MDHHLTVWYAIAFAGNSARKHLTLSSLLIFLFNSNYHYLSSLLISLFNSNLPFMQPPQPVKATTTADFTPTTTAHPFNAPFNTAVLAKGLVVTAPFFIR